MPAEAAVRPLEEATAAIELAEVPAAGDERARRLARLLVDSDALLWALEGRNLRERPKLGRRLPGQVNGLIDRLLFELPEALALTCGLQGVHCGPGTTVARAMDRVYEAQELLFVLRNPGRAALLRALGEQEPKEEVTTSS